MCRKVFVLFTNKRQLAKYWIWNFSAWNAHYKYDVVTYTSYWERLLVNHKELSSKVSKNLNRIFSLVRSSPIPLFKTHSHQNIWPFHTSRITSKILSRSHEIWDISHESKKPNLRTKFSIFLVSTCLKWQMMTQCVTLFVQGPLEVCFVTFINPCKVHVHVLSKPRSKLNHNRSRTIHFQNH